MNSDRKFYQAKVQLQIENDKGQIKKHMEYYLVEAVSVTDVEVIINEEFKMESNFELKSVLETKYVEVLSA